MGIIEQGIAKLVERVFSKSGFTVFKAGEISEIWKNIETLDGRLAIIEADKLVDNVLRRANISGESMAERLRKVEKLVPRAVYSDMWSAHKVRNQLVHEISHNSTYTGKQEDLWKVKKFLISLGAFKNE